jgi:general secretion pathway protein L
MAEYLLMRFLPGEAGRLEWSAAGGGAVSGCRRGTLEEFKTDAGRNPVTLVLPATEVLLTTARLPTANDRNMAAALPFAVEEQFADGVENLYFAHGRRSSGGEIPVMAVRRKLLDERLQLLENAEIRVASVLPETLLLPPRDGHWTMLAEGDCLALRYGPFSGLGIERSVASTILSRLLAE